MLDFEITQECPQCRIPVRTRKLVAHIAFPDDVVEIVELLQGRLNIVPCPVCTSDVPFLIPLSIQRQATSQILAVVPMEAIPEVERAFADSSKSVSYVRCDNYNQLFQKLIPWVDEEIVPGLQAATNSTLFTKPRTERISLITPLLLALLKAQVDDTLPNRVLRMSGDPAEVRELQEKMLTALTHDQVHDLVLHSAENGTLTTILSTIKKQIPASVLSARLLDYCVAQCVTSPVQVLATKDRDLIAEGYYQELINAVLHFYAGKTNPRAVEWATFLRQFWVWSRNLEFAIDNAFFQTPEIIRATTRFEDLWDLSVAGITFEDAKGMNAVFEDAAQMMEKFGFEKEYAAAMGAVPIRFLSGTEKVLHQKDKFIEEVRKRLWGSFEFGRSTEDSYQLGIEVGVWMQQCLAHFPLSVAESLILRLLEDASEAEDAVATVSVIAFGIGPLIDAQSWDLVSRLFEISESFLRDAANKKAVDSASPRLWIQYFNELGNFYLINAKYEQALEAYDRVEPYRVADANQEYGQSTLATVLANKGLVLRSLGEYKKALSLFDQALSTQADHFGARHSKAVVLMEVGDFDQALAEIDRAIAVASKADLHQYGRACVTRARVKNARGDKEGALTDLQTTLRHFANASELFQWAVAAFALEVVTTDSQYHAFLENCENKLRTGLPVMFEQGHLDLAGHTIYVMVTRLLDKNEGERADREFGPSLVELERLSDETEAELDWHLSYVRAKLEHANRRYENVWPSLAEALGKSNRDVPKGDNWEFSASWLTSKEEFQTELSTMALDLHPKDLVSAGEFLRIYEFCNGREISARLQAVDALDIPPDSMLQEISKLAASKGTKIHLLFIIESATKIVLGYYAAGAEVPTLFSDLSIDASTLHSLRDRMREALKFANPANLTALNEIWTEWNSLWKAIGKKLDSLVQDDEHVCILSGRSCTGLPLHLIPLADGCTLFDKCSVTYSPNLATLLDARVRKNTSNNGLLVAVSKQTDTETFRANLTSAVDTLTDVLTKIKQLEILKEQAATLDNIRAALVKSNEVVFLTHGSYGGLRRGFGICISDGDNLPPGLLPVAEVPELERFLLTWDDIEELSETPSLVVSIACSSGQTVVSRGGVRFGLEQSLFASRTRVILSPLWDIDQTAGIAFVKTLYDLKLSKTSLNSARTFQKACFDLRGDFPHPYFWGAFFFNGSLMEALT